MEEKYIPLSKTYVVSNEKDVVGIVSMIDSYLDALFIDIKHQGGGYGKRLLNFIKRQRENIQLKVYKKNNKAVGFYLKNGFVIKEESLDERTSEEEFLMDKYPQLSVEMCQNRDNIRHRGEQLYCNEYSKFN